MGRVIQDTFNTYWAARYGKNRKEVSFRVLSLLSKLPEADGLDDKAFMYDCIGTFGKYLEADAATFTAKDWREIAVKGSYLHDKYTQWPEAQAVVLAIAEFLEEDTWEKDRREHPSNLRQSISSFS